MPSNRPLCHCHSQVSEYELYKNSQMPYQSICLVVHSSLKQIQTICEYIFYIWKTWQKYISFHLKPFWQPRCQLYFECCISPLPNHCLLWTAQTERDLEKSSSKFSTRMVTFRKVGLHVLGIMLWDVLHFREVRPLLFVTSIAFHSVRALLRFSTEEMLELAYIVLILH